jgi:hypothetical protein
VIAASCGLEPGRVVAYKPLLDAAIAEAGHKPDCVALGPPMPHRIDDEKHSGGHATTDADSRQSQYSVGISIPFAALFIT